MMRILYHRSFVHQVPEFLDVAAAAAAASSTFGFTTTSTTPSFAIRESLELGQRYRSSFVAKRQGLQQQSLKCRYSTSSQRQQAVRFSRGYSTTLKRHESQQEVLSLGTGPRACGIPVSTTPDTNTSSTNSHDATYGIQHISNLLQVSHGTITACNANSSSSRLSCWHPLAKKWYYDSDQGIWKVNNPYNKNELIQESDKDEHDEELAAVNVRLLSLAFSDARTALAKIVGGDGCCRYLSLLKLDIPATKHSATLYDGWVIVRELESGTTTTQNSSSSNNNNVHHYHDTKTAFTSLTKVLHDYLAVEHGGGLEDKELAQQLFDAEASLLTVGSDTADATPTEWSAPVGTLLEISRDTYLNGVLFQTVHSHEASLQDAIVAIDIMACGNAATATVRVGNGAQTRVFEDHMLLGRGHAAEWRNKWRILSKTFSPQLWPTTAS